MSKKEAKTTAIRILEKMNIPYQAHKYHCDEFHDSLQIADMLGQPYEKVFKTLVTKGKNGHFVFLIPIHRELDLKAAARSVSQKSLSMIPVKEITAVTGYVRGGCTPLGMKKKFPVVIDKSALDNEKIIVSAGRIGLQIELAPNDLARASDAKFESITHKVRRVEPDMV